MTEAKSKVFRNYRASELPEELLGDISRDALVTVRVDVEQEVVKAMPLKELFAMSRPTFESVEAVNEHVRAMRVEWD